jgi:hypothetical protein
MNRKRFDAEMIRDAALAVAGTLNPKMGGRPVKIPIETGSLRSDLHEIERDGLWPVSPDRNVQNRRGIYLLTSAACGFRCSPLSISPIPLLRVPSAGIHHALQALTLFNSASCRRSRRLCGAARKILPADRACQIDQAWQLALSRRRARRRPAGREFFQTGGTLPDFCLALFNRNEFLYVP